MNKLWMVLVLLCAVMPAAGRSNEVAFFRVSSPSGSWITDFDPAEGTLSWSNEVAGVTNRLRQTYALGGETNWFDYAWLVSTNGGVSGTERVMDLDPPEGMVMIPGGCFLMGDAHGDGYEDELPVHAVYVSAFYMDQYEVTNDRMAEVLQWAYDRGKLLVTSASVENALGGPEELLDLDAEYCRITWDGFSFGVRSEMGPGYPCVEVSWFGAAAYCNYLSEMEGRTPCYNFDGWTCDWSADGYRLPTEAEWEKAARGGRHEKRFPWGDAINHDHANYRANGLVYSYDTSPYTKYTYHPTYAIGDLIYTSPVGSFGATGYELFDMAGNVWEWCWDRYDEDYYSTSPPVNPRGPSSGIFRVGRGGAWRDVASGCRVTYRYNTYPAKSGSNRFGFRAVLSAQ